MQGKQTQAANLIIDRLPTIDQAIDRTAAAADAQGATVLGAAPSGSGLNME